MMTDSAAISAWLTASHPKSEVKLVRAGVVLRWGTTREGSVLRFSFFCFSLFFFHFSSFFAFLLLFPRTFSPLPPLFSLFFSFPSSVPFSFSCAPLCLSAAEG